MCNNMGPIRSGMEAALIEVTSDLLEKCAEREQACLEMADRDNRLVNMSFFMKAVDWLQVSAEEILELGEYSDKDMRLIDSGEFVRCSVSPASLDEDIYLCRSELDQLKVSPEYDRRKIRRCEFRFVACRKHCDEYVSTPSLTLDQLKKFAAGE